MKLFLKQLLKKAPRVRPTIHLETEYHGTEYGGWWIHPRYITQTSVIYSLGVGEDISFDLSLIEKYDLDIFAFDPTPRSIAWINGQELTGKFHFFAFGVADFDGLASFMSPDNPQHISHTLVGDIYQSGNRIEVPVYKLKTIMRKLKHDRIDLLKMDIEGAEYAVLEDMMQSDIYVNQLLVEFHHDFRGISILQTQSTIEKLEDYGLDLFHISSTGREYSFIRRELM